MPSLPLKRELPTEKTGNEAVYLTLWTFDESTCLYNIKQSHCCNLVRHIGFQIHLIRDNESYKYRPRGAGFNPEKVEGLGGYFYVKPKIKALR